MGLDIHFCLERRVPDRATREAKSTLKSIAPVCPSLPRDLVEHCAAQVSTTREWLPVQFYSWLHLPDSEFAAQASKFYEVRAASLLSAVTGRTVPPDPSAPSLWPLLSRADWRQAARDANIDDDEIDECATADAMHSVGLISENGADSGEVFDCFRVSERNYSRFALFSSSLGAARVPSEEVTPLPCMVEDLPVDPRRFTRWLARRSNVKTSFESNLPHPSYLNEMSGKKHCHCLLRDLLATDWDVTCDARGRSRRQVMGSAVVGEFQRLGAEIEEAGLSLVDHRLLMSFD